MNLHLGVDPASVEDPIVVIVEFEQGVFRAFGPLDPETCMEEFEHWQETTTDRQMVQMTKLYPPKTQEVDDG